MKPGSPPSTHSSYDALQRFSTPHAGPYLWGVTLRAMENGVGTSKAMRLMITTVSSMLSPSLPWRFWGRTIDNLPSMRIGGHSASVGPPSPPTPLYRPVPLTTPVLQHWVTAPELLPTSPPTSHPVSTDASHSHNDDHNQSRGGNNG